MQINSETFKKLRKSKGFSQQTLADESGVAKKTIARIESEKEKGEPRGDTVKLLAKALRVKPEVLAEEPESETVREQELQKHGFRPVKLVLNGETILAYGLVADQYGVETRQIINAAPLLFTLLAEMSLNERRRRAKEAEEAIDAFNRIRPEHMEGRSWDAYREKISIAKRDLFARPIDWMEVNEFYYEEERNPFSDFLIRLAKELGENDAIDPEEVHFDPDGFLNYVPLFEKFRKSLTGGSARADYALSRGKVRIADISEELRGEDEDITAERVRRLEAEVSDDEWDEYEERLRPLREATAKIINKSLSEGGKADA